MNIFKKKEKQVTIERKCPAEGCTFTATEAADMKRHIEWKHPEQSRKEESASVQ